MARHMREWRQLTDLICWVPVTCCRTFSSSFSMRPAQWIILENKIRQCSICISRHYHLNMSSGCISFSITVCDGVCFWETVTEWVSSSLAGVKLPDSISGPLSGSIPVLPLLMSPHPHHILHISGRPWQDRQRTCSSCLGWDPPLCYKTAQVWQKCNRSRSWSPVRRSQVWN